MILVVDISSTWTKYGPADAGGVRADAMHRVLREEMTGARWREVFAALPEVDRVACASVNAAAAKALADAARGSGFQVFTLTPQTVPMDFQDYPRPETIGPDRLAGAVAAVHLPLARDVEAIFVVDAGTAVTVDVVVPGKPALFRGGVIAPGREAFAGALERRAPQLPVLAGDVLAGQAGFSPIARTTEDALGAALHFGWPAMVAGVLEAQEAVLRGEGVVRFLTVVVGGDGERLAASLESCGRSVVRVSPAFTLDGIFEACRQAE